MLQQLGWQPCFLEDKPHIKYASMLETTPMALQIKAIQVLIWLVSQPVAHARTLLGHPIGNIPRVPIEFTRLLDAQWPSEQPELPRSHSPALHPSLESDAGSPSLCLHRHNSCKRLADDNHKEVSFKLTLKASAGSLLS